MKWSKLNDALTLILLISLISLFIISEIGSSLGSSLTTNLALGSVAIAIISGAGAAITERLAELE